MVLLLSIPLGFFTLILVFAGVLVIRFGFVLNLIVCPGEIMRFEHR